MSLALLSSIVAVCIAVGVMFLRLKAAKKPVTKKKIILPPLFMSTGAMMYFLPEFRLTSLEIVEVIIAGLIFSIFLIKTTKFEIRDEQIYMKPSKAFIFILVGLLAVRVALKSYLSQSIDLAELSGMFYLLAFAMIISWRIAMYRSYIKLEKNIKRAGISI
ncbi:MULTISPECIES: cytochrome c biogenesis protein CcdC [Bacillus]|uniref:Cytochrome c biogenesis protein CcdC n=2 Tax=Bacillus cereus group TaxID=86661 RepID=A0A2B0X934_BACAN|nr:MULTISPECIES: cytochrome c biogenesis protein CcdC [Bacillus]MCU0096893.1 cytochrome c biogenesis protein CcdC [Bacillus sp. OR9]KZD29550.1 CcdC protein [Bacillus cereus]MBJ8061432.1 cytochrome c biogenesis protein CcdC [Bacillus cereus]MCU4757488.1 cytochrome c biogenesis protein CcdC [Bacillus cereus]MCU5107995.1 cytochrome c biogenesis protein CcdC [Bacillus cereus]